MSYDAVSMGTSMGGARSGRAAPRPVREFSNSEATYSLAWMPTEPACLAVGTNLKWLRIYDTRSPGAGSPLSIVAHPKAVLGLRFDPSNPTRVLSYSDADEGRIKARQAVAPPGSERVTSLNPLPRPHSPHSGVGRSRAAFAHVRGEHARQGALARRLAPVTAGSDCVGRQG